MALTVLGRPPARILRTVTDPAHRHGLAAARRAYEQPVRALGRYVTARGAYPWTARVRTPLGTRSIGCRTWHDLVTVHEVFARGDYDVPGRPAPRTVLDCGANMGIVALWALSARPDAEVHCVEPVEDNLVALHRTLVGFEDRYVLTPTAVSTFDGTVSFGTESTGRYGGIGLDLEDSVDVPCRSIVGLVDECLERWGTIDLLKLDIEGLEFDVLRALDESRLARIGSIALEDGGDLPDDLPLPGFRRSRHLIVHHLARIDGTDAPGHGPA
ncbi:MAG: FkbM family methyltransferase [Solirubrobacteraceae bacterium]|nr:FkbM family methyltransferase [Solirubrobacteraceae bacterium]